MNETAKKLCKATDVKRDKISDKTDKAENGGSAFFENLKRRFSPYKKKVIFYSAISLVIALFLTLNQFWLKIPNAPTWESLIEGSYPEFALPEGEVQVHFIDVGQGDCSLVVTDDKTMLIDSGETENAGDVLDYIKSIGIKRLDVIIASHPHSDHIGAMSSVVDNIDVGQLLLPSMSKDITPETNWYAELLRSADSKAVDVNFVKVGESIILSENCKVEVLAPVNDYDSLNNYSIVCKLIHGENSFLFTGDIETAAEYDLVESGADLNVDVFKVPHHGSATSSSYKLLKTVRPTYAVFTIGSPNSYNHPNKNIYERYKAFNCKRYRTDINGNIVFKSDGTELKVETEFNNEYD